MAGNDAPGGHGCMVPVEFHFAFIPDGNGVVRAIVEWSWAKSARRLVTKAYSAGQQWTNQLPQLPQDMGDQVQRLRTSGRLIAAIDLYARTPGCYRIDDYRGDSGDHTYVIWAGSEVKRNGPRLMPQTVYQYRCIGLDEPPCTQRRLTTYAEVRGLLDNPAAKIVRSFKDVRRQKSKQRNSKGILVSDLYQFFN